MGQNTQPTEDAKEAEKKAVLMRFELGKQPKKPISIARRDESTYRRIVENKETAPPFTMV